MIVPTGYVFVAKWAEFDHTALCGFNIHTAGEDITGLRGTPLAHGESVKVSRSNHFGGVTEVKVTNRDGIPYVGNGRPWRQLSVRELAEEWNLLHVVRTTTVASMLAPHMVVECWQEAGEEDENTTSFTVVDSFSSYPGAYLASIGRYLAKALHEHRRRDEHMDEYRRHELRQEAIAFARAKRTKADKRRGWEEALEAM